MPFGTRFVITLFNLAATWMSWGWVGTMQEVVFLSRRYPLGTPNLHKVELLIWLSIALITAVSATSALGFSFFRAHWAKALWRDAQLRLAWIGSAAAIHTCCMVMNQLFLPQVGYALLSVVFIVIPTMGGIYCAIQTRKYLP